MSLHARPALGPLQKYNTAVRAQTILRLAAALLAVAAPMRGSRFRGGASPALPATPPAPTAAAAAADALLDGRFCAPAPLAPKGIVVVGARAVAEADSSVCNGESGGAVYALANALAVYAHAPAVYAPAGDAAALAGEGGFRHLAGDAEEGARGDADRRVGVCCVGGVCALRGGGGARNGLWRDGLWRDGLGMCGAVPLPMPPLPIPLPIPLPLLPPAAGRGGGAAASAFGLRAWEWASSRSIRSCFSTHDEGSMVSRRAAASRSRTPYSLSVS